MDTKYIGTGGDFPEFELWCDYYLGLGTLTEDVECIFTDDRVYAHSDRSSMNFTALTPGVFQTLIRAADDVKHTGDFGGGPRIISTQGSYIYEPRTNGDPEQFAIQDLSFENHQGNGGGLGSLGGVTLNRVIISTTIGQSNRAAFYHLSSRGGLVLNACRAHSLSGGTWGWGFDLNQNGGYKIDAVNCTATGFAIGVRLGGSAVIHNGRFKNIVTYDCPLGFSDTGGNGWADDSNNASDDGTHPGDDGVLITADPFEADGYTPSQGGQLDAAGIDAGVILGADGKPFAIVPAIGAYQTYTPFDDVAPILTNPTSAGNFRGLLGTVDTDEANGGIYGVSTDTATKPEPEQVEAGQDHLGATANDSQSGAVTTTGSQSLLMINVDEGTTQHVHFMHKDAAGNYSLVVTAASIVVPDYYAQVIYDGMVIPPDSILHLYDGTHTGADASATLTTALNLTLDAVVGRVCKNTADGSEGIITGNTAGPNSVITVTLAGGTDNLFDTGDTYEIQIDADNPDVIWYERATTFAGGSASFSWYLEDVSEDQLSPEYTAIYNLPGQPDGEYNITINVKGVVSFDLVSVPSESGNRMDNTLAATGGPTINDGLADWLSKAGNENINDATRRWLIAQGATPAPLSDMWLEFLRGLGYTGTVSDMKASFWRNGGA